MCVYYLSIVSIFIPKPNYRTGVVFSISYDFFLIIAFFQFEFLEVLGLTNLTNLRIFKNNPFTFWPDL